MAVQLGTMQMDMASSCFTGDRLEKNVAMDDHSSTSSALGTAKMDEDSRQTSNSEENEPQVSEQLDTVSTLTLDSPKANGASEMGIQDDVAEENTAMDEIRQNQLTLVSSGNKKSFGGLSNLGNTCYMASALQMLASLDGFVAHVSEEELRNLDEEKTKLRNAFVDVMKRLQQGETVRPDAIKDAIDARVPNFVGFRQQDSHEFLTTLLDLLDEDYKAENKTAEAQEADIAETEEEKVDEEMTEAVSEVKEEASASNEMVDDEDEVPEEQPLILSPPKSFSMLDIDGIDSLLHGANSCRETLVLPTLTMTTPRYPYRLVGGRMNASDVVLTPWSDIKETDEQAASALPVEEEASVAGCPTATVESEGPYCSPVESMFTTRVRVKLTCDSCKFSRSHNETYLHLSLEIGPSSSSVDDSLRRFFAPERRDIKCEKCFCETATQTTEITELPRAILLHFKRFIVDISPDYTSVTYRKDQSAISFDDKLVVQEDFGVLSEFLASDCTLPGSRTLSSEPMTYSIRSVVNHIGSTASCGHYTADANRLYSDENRKWTRFNDSYVSSVSAEDAIDNARSTAYMVMYELE